MTWFAHRCWFCGLKSRDVEFIAGDGNYQCKWELREECQERRYELYGKPGYLRYGMDSR